MIKLSDLAKDAGSPKRKTWKEPCCPGHWWQCSMERGHKQLLINAYGTYSCIWWRIKCQLNLKCPLLFKWSCDTWWLSCLQTSLTYWQHEPLQQTPASTGTKKLGQCSFSLHHCIISAVQSVQSLDSTTTVVLQLFWIFSRTTWVSQYQKGKTRKVKPIWIYRSKRQCVAVAFAWPYANHLICTSLQTDNYASSPPLSFYRPFLLPNQQHQSTEGSNH